MKHYKLQEILNYRNIISIDKEALLQWKELYFSYLQSALNELLVRFPNKTHGKADKLVCTETYYA